MGSDGIGRLFVADGEIDIVDYMLADQLLSLKGVIDAAAWITFLVSVVEPGAERCFFLVALPNH